MLPSVQLRSHQDLGPKIQKPHTTTKSEMPVRQPSSKSPRPTSPTPKTDIVHSSIIHRNADALLELLGEELKKAQSKHERALSALIVNHRADISRLNAMHAVELACLETALCRTEAEFEDRLNNVRSSALAVQQLKSDEFLHRTQSEMEAAHKLQLEGVQKRFMEQYQEILEKLTVRAKDSAAKANEVENRLKGVEAKLEEAARARDDQMAQMKGREERWIRQSSQREIELHAKWEEEKHRLEGCIEAERKKHVGDERARKKVEENVKKEQSTQTEMAGNVSTKEKEKLDEEEATRKTSVAHIGYGEQVDWTGLEGVRMALEEADDIPQAEIDKALARHQKRTTRGRTRAIPPSKASTNAMSNRAQSNRSGDDSDILQAVKELAREPAQFIRDLEQAKIVTEKSAEGAKALADRRKLDEEMKSLDVHKKALNQQTAAFEEEKRIFEGAKGRLEVQVEEFQGMMIRQNEFDKQKWEEEKREWKQLMKATAEKERKEIETKAMTEMQQRMQDWQTATAKELADITEDIAKEREALAEEKEALEDERREIARRQLEDREKLEEAERIRIEKLNDLWEKEIEDRWAKLAETKKEEQERRGKDDEDGQKDTELLRCQNELKAMEDKIKLLEDRLREREAPAKQVPESDLGHQAKGVLERLLSEGQDNTSEWNRQPNDPCYHQ
ncbi:hypothetical protein GALMADRAFT_252084 [Galerina marginata CBS 339.88]|uniref:Uncharacterized protein n=1 Tax=Galerina marginata (strain CBS 339.88) TaxID=685588 RepID=A0A067SRY3_GALM3|nr:hypothetical protein GALMADRAFT_252084 [Galerina marginata CBS 339.88]